MNESVSYRLALALGFLREAEQDLTLQRWRSAVSHAQLSVENSLKAVMALFVPVGKTHDPARALSTLAARQQIPEQWQAAVQKLAKLGRPLGPQLHIQTDYGDEDSGRLPWDLFDEEDARDAVQTAQEILAGAEQLIEEVNDA